MPMRIVLVVLGFLGLTALAPGVTLAAQTVRCESPDFQYRQCRVDTRGGVRLTQQLSRAPCIRDQNWGVDRDGIWVDQGCAAEFRVDDFHHQGGYPGGGYQGEGYRGGDGRRVVCESRDFRYNVCRLDTRGEVRLARQLSNAPCRLGDTWGVARDGIWVDQGCAGEFLVEADSGGVAPPWRNDGNTGWNSGGPSSRGRGDRQRLICESRDYRYNLCAADTRDGVRLVQQLSNSPCRQGDTWGVTHQGVWVDQGCVGEFALGRGTAGQKGIPQYRQGVLPPRQGGINR